MINIILADHQIVFRVGMASALAAEDDMRIIGQPQSIEQLMHGLASFRPHVLVLSSAYLVRIDDIKKLCTAQRTAIVLLEDPGDAIVQQYSSDVHGVIQRSAEPETAIRCIRHVMRGGTVLRTAQTFASGTWSNEDGLRMQQRLTLHELRVIGFVVQGYRNREIATRMGTTEGAVKHSLRKIFDKTGTFDRLELALYVMHHRVLKLAMTGARPQPVMGLIRTPRPEWHQSSGSTTVN